MFATGNECDSNRRSVRVQKQTNRERERGREGER